VVAGFSQGASLVAEFLARGGGARTGSGQLMGAAILTGALLGPAQARTLPTGVAGLDMYLSVAREDPWLSLAEARATADAFSAAGARVHFEALADREHLISDAAVAGVRRLLEAR
jgi:predicted esterase